MRVLRDASQPMSVEMPYPDLCQALLDQLGILSSEWPAAKMVFTHIYFIVMDKTEDFEREALPYLRAASTNKLLGPHFKIFTLLIGADLLLCGKCHIRD